VKKQTCKRGHVMPPRTKHGACIPCCKAYRQETYTRDRERRIRLAIEWAKTNPDARRDQQRASRLGVSVDEVRAVIAASGGRCGACGLLLTPVRMCVDHCHVTGRIRGVLCRFCNALEGMLTKKKERVAQVFDYLRRASERVVDSRSTIPRYFVHFAEHTPHDFIDAVETYGHVVEVKMYADPLGSVGGAGMVYGSAEVELRGESDAD
jgi:hypothetical protein